MTAKAKAAKPAKPAKPTFFATPADFRAWLAANHATATELLVGFHKVGSGKPSITWPQSVDQALCFGWIDGVRRSLGRRRVHDPLHAAPPAQHLERDQHAGASPSSKRGPGRRRRPRRVRRRASAKRSGVYSFEQAQAARARRPRRSKAFRANAKAWAFFTSRPPWYQRTATALGGQRQERGDARQAPAHADRRLRRRPHHRAAHAPRRQAG